MRTTRAQAAGSARAQHGLAATSTSSAHLALAGAQRELGGHGARDLAQLDRLGAQLHGGVEPREVEQLAGQHRQPAQLAPGALDLLLGVGEVAAVAQVLVEQLHRALEHRQRRAQLVRGGGDERAPRRLLAAQLLLHAAERAREVADLVAAAVDRRGRLRALGGDPQRGALQAPEAAGERAREREPERRRRPRGRSPRRRRARCARA